MPTPTFRYTRAGDKVWDIRFGWGVVSDVKAAAPHGNYQLAARFFIKAGSVERIFSLEGVDVECINQTLFEKEMKIVGDG